ncbi:MAG: hypothetical protein ACREID_06165 [Planctomycetota bacterium]
MAYLVVPAVIAGFLGLVAHGAEAGEAYLQRVRLLCLGAALLGLAGAVAFSIARAKGGRRWLAALGALVAARIAYTPLLAAAFVATGWLEWTAARLGASSLSLPVHYGLGCLIAAFTTIAGLLLPYALSDLENRRRIPLLLAWILAGVLAFAHPEDRELLPHPFGSGAPAPSAVGPSYGDAVEDDALSVRARAVALFGLARHAGTPRAGWAGAARDEMVARFRSSPDAPLRARVAAFEAALLTARKALETSARTPPG